LLQGAQIEAAVRFIVEEVPSYSQDALSQIAVLAWSRGRHCLRIGCPSAAGSYFQLAHNIEPGIKPAGSQVYRMLCRLMGPQRSEGMLEAFKRVLGKANGESWR